MVEPNTGHMNEFRPPPGLEHLAPSHGHQALVSVASEEPKIVPRMRQPNVKVSMQDAWELDSSHFGSGGMGKTSPPVMSELKSLLDFFSSSEDVLMGA